MDMDYASCSRMHPGSLKTPCRSSHPATSQSRPPPAPLSFSHSFLSPVHLPPSPRPPHRVSSVRSLRGGTVWWLTGGVFGGAGFIAVKPPGRGEPLRGRRRSDNPNSLGGEITNLPADLCWWPPLLRALAQVMPGEILAKECF